MYEKKIAEMLAKRGLTPEIDCPNIKGKDGSGTVQISIDEGLSTISYS